ncbi:hypothetical protein CKAH01_02251 [Colletotrichum kahawae]|uniref:Uncharacterized protein n=1 Tax=Colletotrichum kahawae TaxID=34407 RepID=A0AAD9Y0I7_COLKA|nr:hypothetical protein CKAH01_02251 [Colletotrichum kahawae]
MSCGGRGRVSAALHGPLYSERTTPYCAFLRPNEHTNVNLKKRPPGASVPPKRGTDSGSRTTGASRQGFACFIGRITRTRFYRLSSQEAEQVSAKPYEEPG